MSDYYPPSENLPIFDVSVFRSTNDNVITQDDGDRLYLSRQGTASSLATSTNFVGTISCGGNLTLNAPLASDRQIEASFFKLKDTASVSTNKPLISYTDPLLQITTNDTLSTVKSIELKSFNGTATNVSTSLVASYGTVDMEGTLTLKQKLTPANTSYVEMQGGNLMIQNQVSAGSITISTINIGGSGNINLRASGSIIADSIIVPSDTIPAVIGIRPSIGYSYSGSNAAVAITVGTPISITTAISIPIGTWMFESSVTVVKSTSTFNTVATLSSSRLSYNNAAGLAFVGSNNSFENMYANNEITGLGPCGVVGQTRIVTITTAQQIPLTFQAASWTLLGSPTFTLRWSITRIA